MLLNELLNGIEYTFKGNLNVEIEDIVYDSRIARENTAFVCIVGFQLDGHNYAADAYAKGTRVFIAQRDIELPEDATVVITADNRKTLALMSANLFGHPDKELFTVGITGTKGKTSISYMLKSVLEKAGEKVGIIGTTGIIYGDKIIKTNNSTPESYIIHKYYREMLNAGCTAAIIEATSQGFMLDRTYGIEFDLGLFANLSPDHIGANEHKDFDDYLNCKKMIFGQAKKVFVNRDSEYYDRIVKDIPREKYRRFGFFGDAGIMAENLNFVSGDHRLITEFDCRDSEGLHHFKISQPGEFSVYNALAVIACARERGVPYEVIEEGLKNTYIRGRMEIIPGTTDYTVMIDFAHNEFSVQNLFETILKYSPKRIVAVFGCGGNRSKLRRYSMGEVIGKNADLSIITEDNNRYEKIEDIVSDILVGMKKADGKYIVINKRKDAIEYALENAQKGDVIMLIGKGHEDYIEENGTRTYFSEREVVENYLSRASR
ncbi:MAG: UDP-N-acetylmuramoyl-L-alanyl-D-glutamate--2,6-diaminopimelate ligase [Ruminococcaceae bacterium]|nr:UDP-N-acetylmuramoyl-L-alanyl-D-glutamate--2,6-diaminopimelate ligase [Oscillospiraceae bacterium]MBQ3598282.1 UDP-N-acetylmuramoyl-L-alanyl-D-glutamate--2,6-diaminopimelate ligase [Clostridia bacterium]MBR2915376.1 UDP-N-acetylmuramoyl-L-alanyl-D-glutamate--2,6-diaminopimelate ligase [Clostridia bacterium]